MGGQTRAGREDPMLIELVTGNAGAARDLGTQKAFRHPTQEPDPSTPTLFISLEGVALRGLCDPFQQQLPEAWHPLSWDICLSVRASLPSPKSRQRAPQQLSSSHLPAYVPDFLRRRDDKERLAPGNTGGLRVGIDLASLLPTHDHLEGHSRAVGA